MLFCRYSIFSLYSCQLTKYSINRIGLDKFNLCLIRFFVDLLLYKYRYSISFFNGYVFRPKFARSGLVVFYSLVIHWFA